MTTGPFNWLVALPIDQSWTRSLSTGEVIVSWRYGVAADRARYIRPVSVKTVKDPSGWRPPVAWNSSGYHVTIAPKGVATFTRTLYYARELLETDVFTEGFSCQPYSVSPPNHDFSSLEDRAITKALLNLKNQKVNLAVAYAERKETAELFETASTRIVSDVLGFRRKMSGEIAREARSGYYRHQRFNNLSVPGRKYGRYYRAYSVWSDLLNRRVGVSATLSNAWLELTYGWRPFMQDLYGSVEAIVDAGLGHDASRCTVKASVKDVETSRFDLSMTSEWISESVPTASFSMRRVDTHTCHVSLTYVLANEILYSMAQMGITNPAELAWERIPFSFVVDWFLPVGNFLQTLDADFGMRFIGGSVGKMTRRVDSCVGIKSSKWYHRNGGDFDEWELSNYSGGYPGGRYHEFSRKLYLASPLPTVPRFKNPISAGHIANALALLKNVGSLASFVKR